MNIKKGDTVQVITGKYRTKKGEVKTVLREADKVVVEGVKAGQELTGWIMEQDKTVTVKTRSDVPIGHKIALQALQTGDTVIKYGVDIGRVVAPIQTGEHLHVHNVETKRW